MIELLFSKSRFLCYLTSILLRLVRIPRVIHGIEIGSSIRGGNLRFLCGISPTLSFHLHAEASLDISKKRLGEVARELTTIGFASLFGDSNDSVFDVHRGAAGDVCGESVKVCLRDAAAFQEAGERFNRSVVAVFHLAVSRDIRSGTDG